MPSNEVDELYVSLSLQMGELEDEIEEAADEIDQFERRLNRSMRGSQDEIEDTAGEVSVLKARLDALNGNTVEIDTRLDADETRAQLRALDSQEIDVEVDTDTDRAFGASRGGGGIFGGNRLPGELDEVQEGFVALSAVPPKLKALGAAGATAAAALGAGAGLAGVATKLAAELGPQGLQSDVQGARATFKEAGRKFASEFSGVIRSEVLPAARGFAVAIQTVDDELATFSGVMIDLLKNIQGVGPLIGAVVGAGRVGGESQSNADALAQGVGDVPGIREITRTMTQAIQRVRQRFKRDLIPREDMLQQIKGLRLDAVKQLQKLKQQVPGAFPPALIDQFAKKLREGKKQLRDIRKLYDGDLREETSQPADAAAVEPAGSVGAPSTVGGLDVAEISQKMQREARRLQQTLNQALTRAQEFFRAIRPAVVQGVQSLTDGIGRALGDALFADPRQVQRLRDRRRRIQQNLRQARDAGNFQQVRQLSKELDQVNEKLNQTQSIFGRLGEAFKDFGNIAKQVLEQVISKLASAALLSLALAPFTGGLSSFGSNFTTILGGGMPDLQGTGGAAVMPEATGAVGAGMPMPSQMIQPGAVATAVPSGAGANITVNVTGETTTSGRDIKTSYDTTTKVQRRKGHSSRS